ncbi:MAG: hypothetical protein ACREJG_02770 [Candidatus Rokuibacteriota bacterium]
MDDQVRHQEMERRGQERRRAQEAGRTAHDAGRAMGEMASIGAESAAVWADANQRALGEIFELTAGTAKEGARLYGQMQQNAIDVVREMQSAALRWQTMWPEMFRDPFRCYQRMVMDSVDYAQRGFRLMGGAAEAMTESVDRLQQSAAEAGKGIQETFSSATSRMKDVHAQGDARERSAA